LHGESDTDSERGQRHHRCGAHPDKDHLPENRGDVEKLSGERGDEHPVKQIQIEAEIVFQKSR